MITKLKIYKCYCIKNKYNVDNIKMCLLMINYKYN